MGQTCDICGGDDRPVERTTVATIAPLKADLCPVCAHVQDHQMPEDRCAQCGDEIGTGFHLEVEFQLGDDLPANLAVDLCQDCAGWVAHRVNYRGVENDEDAHAEYCRLVGIDAADLAESA